MWYGVTLFGLKPSEVVWWCSVYHGSHNCDMCCDTELLSFLRRLSAFWWGWCSWAASCALHTPCLASQMAGQSVSCRRDTMELGFLMYARAKWVEHWPRKSPLQFLPQLGTLHGGSVWLLFSSWVKMLYWRIEELLDQRGGSRGKLGLLLAAAPACNRKVLSFS